jgi:hypothetical protein
MGNRDNGQNFSVLRCLPDGNYFKAVKECWICGCKFVGLEASRVRAKESATQQLDKHLKTCVEHIETMKVLT